ncbi:MAG: YihA family ribosome biogenesis GTP-binding protein [Clostridia bacterium]|nr:YihA family ribosome biogenesis GTP-binding protein [Clostridia bacterium]
MNYNKADFETSFGLSSQLPESTVCEIAFAGRSNVGKSSLINKLLNRKKLARISSVPGKTVTINFYKVDNIRFVDLPGYGYAKVSAGEKKRWSDLMEHYFSSGRNIGLVIQLVDMRHPVTGDDIMMMDFMSEYGYNFIVAATKSDKLNKSEYAKRQQELIEELSAYEGVEVIPFSSVNGQGVEELKKIIEQYSQSR